MEIVTSVIEAELFYKVHSLSTAPPAVSLDGLFAHSHGCPPLWWNPSICHRVNLHSAEKVDTADLNTKYSGKLNAFAFTSLTTLKVTLTVVANNPVNKKELMENLSEVLHCSENISQTSCPSLIFSSEIFTSYMSTQQGCLHSPSIFAVWSNCSNQT